MEQAVRVPVSMYCLKCGHKIIGYQGEDGSVRMECKKCGVVVFSKPRRPHELAIRVISKRAV